ncbi:MAG: hypothetical protein IKZ98_14720 [Clostridia bacterium]|nr:hypothetical protein [Clostridia bacterium]
MEQENLIPIYFSDLPNDYDSLLHSMFEVLDKKRMHAWRHVPAGIKEAFENHHLHDWIVSSIQISHEGSICAEIKAIHGESECTMRFENIKQFGINGEISLKGLSYPSLPNDPPGIAQIQDIWVEYNKDLEFLILLNDSQYIKIVTQVPRSKRSSGPRE